MHNQFFHNFRASRLGNQSANFVRSSRTSCDEVPKCVVLHRCIFASIESLDFRCYVCINSWARLSLIINCTLICWPLKPTCLWLKNTGTNLFIPLELMIPWPGNWALPDFRWLICTSAFLSTSFAIYFHVTKGRSDSTTWLLGNLILMRQKETRTMWVYYYTNNVPLFFVIKVQRSIIQTRETIAWIILADQDLTDHDHQIN